MCRLRDLLSSSVSGSPWAAGSPRRFLLLLFPLQGGFCHDRKGLFTIGTDKTGKPNRVKWHKIRAEYINGTSQAKLAKKYHVSRTTIANHCRKEGWTEQRESAKAEIQQNIIQKTAEAVADNATIAQRIKQKLLLKLEKEIDALPDLIGSGQTQSNSDREYKNRNLVKVKDTITQYKLKDLTAAYKDLTADMAQPDEGGSALLESLLALERRASDG